MKLNNAIKNRWSPRAFSDKTVSEEMLLLLFEAARWAPSARNEQPWNYYYAGKGSQEFDDITNILTGINPEWAQNAKFLIISVLKKQYDYQNRLNRNALHDIGAANVSLAIQAAEMGLQVHQMGGFDKEKAIEYLNIDPDKFQPVTVIAVGYPGSPETLSEELKKRETQQRTRKKVSEFVTKLKK